MDAAELPGAAVILGNRFGRGLVPAMLLASGLELLIVLPGPAAHAASAPVAARQLPLDRLPIAARVKVPVGPGWLESGFGSIWVSKSESHQVLRIDPATNQVIATIAVGSDPELGLAVGLGAVWVPDPKDGTLTQISPQTNRVVRVLHVPLAADPEGSIGIGAGSLWMITRTATSEAGTVSRLDARSGRIVAQIPVQPDSHAVIFAFDAAWVTSSAAGTVSRIDPATNQVGDVIGVPAGPRFLLAGADAIWVLSQGDGSLARIDAHSRRVIARIPLDVPGDGGDLSMGEGAIWVSAEGVPLSQVDPANNTLVRQFVGGQKDDTLRVAFGAAWIISELDGEIWRIPVAAVKRLPVPP